MSRYGDSARNVFEIYYETGLTLPIYLSRTTWSPTTLVVIKSIGGVTSGKLSGVGHFHTLMMPLLFVIFMALSLLLTLNAQVAVLISGS
jgi:SNF family Na+-dependent transporter